MEEYDITVRIEKVKWCRTLAPFGYPNRSTMCVTFCTTKETPPFAKEYVTPEYLVNLPAMSRGITYRIRVQVQGDDVKLVRVLDVVSTQGPNFARLKSQLCDTIRHTDTRLKISVIRDVWYPQIYKDMGCTADEFKAKPIGERRALWASQDWSKYHKFVQQAVDGLWMPKETLRSLMGVCLYQRTAVLPTYWELQGREDEPGIDRSCPPTLVMHNKWQPLGWSVCLPFDPTTTTGQAFKYWSRWAAVLNDNVHPNQREQFTSLVQAEHMTTVGLVTFWSQWKPQWEAVQDLWIQESGLEPGGPALTERNCRTVISLVGTCESFLYEWPNPKERTTVFTTNVERAEMLQSLGYHVVVFSLKGVFTEFGDSTVTERKRKPLVLSKNTIRINVSVARYVLFDNAQDWTLAHGYRALKHIQTWTDDDVRVGLLYIKPRSDLVRWDNDASPRILAALLACSTADITYHVCENVDDHDVGVPERIESWKKVQGVYAADDTGVLRNKMDEFVGLAQRPIFVCETQKLVSHVNDILFDTSSRTRLFQTERVYIESLDMYGEITGFVSHDRRRRNKIEQGSAGMYRDRPLDVKISIGGIEQTFELDKLKATKATAVTPGMMRGHSGWVLFVLGSDGWMSIDSFKRYLCLVNPRLARLVAPRARLKQLLKPS
jgi:hypothetical protein